MLVGYPYADFEQLSFKADSPARRLAFDSDGSGGGDEFTRRPDGNGCHVGPG